MRKEIEIQGCVEVSPEIDIDHFTDEFIKWVESKVRFLNDVCRSSQSELDGKMMQGFAQ